MARWVSKALAVGPGLAVSTAVTVVVGPVLHPILGAVIFFGGLLTAVLLLVGRGEPLAARLLMFSRPARPEELEVVAPAVTTLCAAGLGPPVIQLRVRDRQHGIWASGAGRRTVVLSSGLIEAVADGDLPQEQAAAVIGHAAALTRGGWTRCDAALAFWSLPWQVLRTVASAVARAGRGLPLVSFAWRMRFVVIAIAVVQNIYAGRPWLAVGIGGIGALSYAIPVWERSWQMMILHAGDRALVDAGMAGPWAAVLRRCPRTPLTRSRLHMLEVPTSTARRLELVAPR